jgi:hypothetical protein
MDGTEAALPNAGTYATMNMIMSFAYIEGQEAEALSYYEQRLLTTADPDERKQLEILVKTLRAVVEKADQRLPNLPLCSLSLSCS